jgi:formyltetrahydrofolate synthetase
MQTDIEIAQLAEMRKISDLAKTRVEIPEDELETFGRFKAKVSLSYLCVNIVLATHWGKGGKGAADLARMIVDLCEADHQQMQYVYEDQDTLWEKINKIAKKVYRAGEVTADKKVQAQIEDLERQGYPEFDSLKCKQLIPMGFGLKRSTTD